MASSNDVIFGALLAAERRHRVKSYGGSSRRSMSLTSESRARVIGSITGVVIVGGIRWNSVESTLNDSVDLIDARCFFPQTDQE